jgi:hypothetical protein
MNSWQHLSFVGKPNNGAEANPVGAETSQAALDYDQLATLGKTLRATSKQAHPVHLRETVMT